MNGLSGMEKFSHLEDKIYLTIQFAQRQREEKVEISKELSMIRHENTVLSQSVTSLELQLLQLLSERDVIQLKVESMLEAMTALDPAVAEALGR